MLRQKVKWREIFDYLNGQLREQEQTGEVVAIVTMNSNGKRLCCYGYWIKDERLFACLRPTIGRTKIAHSRICRLASWQTGYFVRLREFEPSVDKERWVALINIAIARFELTIPFPRQP